MLNQRLSLERKKKERERDWAGALADDGFSGERRGVVCVLEMI